MSRRAPPLIHFDRASNVPALHQIANHLRTLLVEERLVPGEPLPSVRRLAMELGVHFNTVADAYRLLAAEGWLDLQHGRGARVLPRITPATHPRRWMNEFRRSLRSLVAQTRASGADAQQISDELKALAKELS